MIRSFTVYTIAAVMAVTSLGLKALLDVPIDYDRLNPLFLSTVEKALVTSSFQPLVRADDRTIAAFRGQCFVWIGPSSPDGGAAAAFIADYGGLGRVSYWYRGAIFERLPNVTVLIDRYLERSKVAVGREPELHPVYHLVSTQDCVIGDLEKLRLDDFLPNAGR